MYIFVIYVPSAVCTSSSFVVPPRQGFVGSNESRRASRGVLSVLFSGTGPVSSRRREVPHLSTARRRRRARAMESTRAYPQNIRKLMTKRGIGDASWELYQHFQHGTGGGRAERARGRAVVPEGEAVGARRRAVAVSRLRIRVSKLFREFRVRGTGEHRDPHGEGQERLRRVRVGARLSLQPRNRRREARRWRERVLVRRSKGAGTIPPR